MKKYYALSLTILGIFIIIALGFNLLLTHLSNHSFEKLYNVEVNRAYTRLTDGLDYSDLDLSGFEYIESVEYLEANVPRESAVEFFQSSQLSVVYPLYQDETIDGYIKFRLSSNERIYTRNIRISVNILLAVILLFLAAIFFYFKKQIMAPFQRITDLPLALSKGSLTVPVPQSRSRFFGNFIWGLNMLRETLETHKKNELELQKEKKTLILSISHDIKTPLNAINLYTKALKENLYAGEAKRIDLLDNIDKQGRDIENFVNDIIKASKEDFLDIRIPAGEFYLGTLDNRLRDYYDEKLALLKTEFTVDFLDNPLLSGDLDRTVEAMQNIIENAIKYGDGKAIRITSSDEEGRRLITVSNTGCTLPENEIIHLFDSFFRGSNSRIQTGSGLGLYICRQILKQMDGEIYAESRDGMMFITIVLNKV